MAGPKSSPIADQQKQDAKSGISYKAKLMEPSSHDELSVPDQSKDEERPKLPPVKDEGSPPMVPDTEAAGSTTKGDSLASSSPDQTRQEASADKDGFIPVTTSKHTGASAEGATNQEDKTGASAQKTDTGLTTITPPEVTPAGVTLSDVEREALSDPSTADLVAAVTGATPSDTPQVTPQDESSLQANVTLAGDVVHVIQPLDDTDDSQLAKGGHADKDSSSDTAAAAATSGDGSSDIISSSSGQGAKGASAAAAAAASADSSDDVSLPTPAAAAKMAVGNETASPAAAAVNDAAAKAAAESELPEKRAEGEHAYTPADFAATGLAALEAEADAAAAAAGGSSSMGAGDRMSSVMTDRTDSGWYERSYSLMKPSSAAELAGMDPLLERSEEPLSEDGAVGQKSESSESSKDVGAKGEGEGPPQGYAALAQAPAVSDDAAAVPAPPEPADTTSSSSSGGSGAESQGQEAGEGPTGAGDSSRCVFAGFGSGKESGRGSVSIMPEPVVAGDKEDPATAGTDEPVSAEGAAAEGSAAEGTAAEGPAAAAPAAPAAPAAAAEAPAGDSPVADSASDSEMSEKVENLPLPLKLAGGAAKAMIDSVADAAEAVKDVLIGPDVDL